MLTIEPVESRNSAVIQEIIADPEMAVTCDIPSAPPPDAASGWIARMKSLEEKGAGRTFVIVADGSVVGACGLYRIDREHGIAEMGFFVGKRYWRRGYASSAGRTLLARAFTGTGLRSVQASCLAWNAGAKATLKKLGFQPAHEEPPPPGSKFPPEERHQYWKLDREQWVMLEQTAKIPK